MTPTELLRRVRASRTPTILLLTRFPVGDDLKDGFFQRVASIDALLAGATRVYVDNDRSYRGLLPSVREVAEGAWNVRCRTSYPHHLAYLALLARAGTATYAHSIHTLSNWRRRRVFSLGRRRVLDVHGAVPEELVLMGSRHAGSMAAVERWALGRAHVVVSVTDAMNQHLRAKHGLRPDSKEFIRLPIFPRAAAPAERPRHGRAVVYCGGLQAWQRIDEMLAWVRARRPECSFTFLVPDPQALRRRYQELHGEDFPGEVASATPAEVRAHYARNAFGLVLREDIVVNRVACPTKLIEYLQHDLVPIVDSARIGDFEALGMRSVPLGAPLPAEAERLEMIERNRQVLRRLDEAFRSGAAALARTLIQEPGTP